MMKEKKTVRQWIGEHKEQIIISALAVGSFALGYYICKSHTKPVFIEKGMDCGIMPEKPYRAIDEDIFTILAPMIEDAVLQEGLDEYVINDVYTVPFPKNGDWKNGVYKVLKEVTVTIKDIGDAMDPELFKGEG